MDKPSLRLPAGMRDFTPRAAAARRRIAETLLGVFERWGYARVITPAFEYEDVLALGLGAAGREAALRFVEPSSGRVVAMRPDITPQIARLIATRFHDESGPVRLCYEGTVLRLERGARSQRELIQAGVELAGVASPEGEAEVIALGTEALAASGIVNPTVDLGHLGLMRGLLDALKLPPGAVPAVRAAIAKRDPAALEEALRDARGGAAVIKFARALPDLSGDPALLDKAREQAPTDALRVAIRELQKLVDALTRQALPARLHVDLAEVRGSDYYTGVRFQGFVPGSAEPVLQGGRYDDLLPRYGRPGPAPAVGFAIDVEAAAAALEAASPDHTVSTVDGQPRPALVVGPAADAARTAAALRATGRPAAVLLGPMPDDEIESYAARWGFGEIIKAHSPKQGAGPRK